MLTDERSPGAQPIMVCGSVAACLAIGTFALVPRLGDRVLHLPMMARGLL